MGHAGVLDRAALRAKDHAYESVSSSRYAVPPRTARKLRVELTSCLRSHIL